MQKIRYTGIINYAIAFVWLLNGLFCKFLNFVPRHQQIVGRILGENNAFTFTKTIGFFEVLMCFWIISRIKSKWCAMLQIIIIATMNIIEFFVVPDLLLYGKFNIVVASFFMFIIYLNEFILSKNKTLIS